MSIELATVGLTLKEIVNSGVVKQVTDLVTTVREGEDDKKTIDAYEEAFNKLIQENQELKSIALRYKDEYDQIFLKEEDIEYLQTTATRLMNLFMSNATSEQKEAFEQLIDLIQVDTLRTMQLLGFNYKEAIGEPLTEVTSQAILSAFNKNDEQDDNSNNN